MATLRIIRSNEFTNKLRKISIMINDRKIGEISNGETREFEIADGLNTVGAKIDWCKSNQLCISASANHIITISLTSFAKHTSFGILAASYYALIARDKYLRLIEE